SLVSETRHERRGVVVIAPDMDIAEPVALSPLEQQLATLLDGADQDSGGFDDGVQRHAPGGCRAVQDVASLVTGANDATQKQDQLELDIGRLAPRRAGTVMDAPNFLAHALGTHIEHRMYVERAASKVGVHARDVRDAPGQLEHSLSSATHCERRM